MSVPKRATFPIRKHEEASELVPRFWRSDIFVALPARFFLAFRAVHPARLRKIGAFEVRRGEIGPGQVGPGEVGIGEVGIREIGLRRSLLLPAWSPEELALGA